MGQNINKAEYFIDTDPGFGKATNIPISVPANDVSLSYSVNISSLSQGFHMMVYRARDDKGHWSVAQEQVFYVFRSQNTTATNVNKAEYFIDIDPGFGKATNIPVSSPGKDVSLSFNVTLTALSEGFHMMVLRSRDTQGRWSPAREQVFYVYKSQSAAGTNITKAEYFIDTDPGFGKATSIPVASPAKDLSLSFNVNTGSLEGFHVIVLRARDNLGHWSANRQQVFYVFKTLAASASNITGIEYFIDADPGFGKGTFYSVPVPAGKVAAEFTVNLTGVTNGNHVLYFRAKDASGRYSELYAHAITVTLSGIGDVDITSWFRLYPNPNSGDFIMDFTDLQGKSVTFAIFDMNGRQVYSDELSGENNLVSVDLPSGIYMVTVDAVDRSFKQKLVINR
jgi:hypothetical protein